MQNSRWWYRMTTYLGSGDRTTEAYAGYQNDSAFKAASTFDPLMASRMLYGARLELKRAEFGDLE